MAVLDQMWKSHLEFLDRLKVDVNLRSVAQKNPLNEFKREAFYAFENMLKEWSKTVIQAFLRVQITKYR